MAIADRKHQPAGVEAELPGDGGFGSDAPLLEVTLCPWHQDSNASLTVSPRTNRVHCFVCNKGTDPIGWLQDRQGLSFTEAVHELARRYAIPLPDQDPKAAARAEAERQERQRLRQWRSRQEDDFHQALLTDLQALGPAATYWASPDSVDKSLRVTP